MSARDHPVKIEAATARRLAIRCQGLDGAWELPGGKEGVAQVIERLGYVQIDTIAVVQRAHDHTLWSRRPEYIPQMLHELQARDRRVFEYWTHAASFVPMRDYRYCLHRMRAFAESPRMRQWREQNHALVQEILARIQAEGPPGYPRSGSRPTSRRRPDGNGDRGGTGSPPRKRWSGSSGRAS